LDDKSFAKGVVFERLYVILPGGKGLFFARGFRAVNVKRGYKTFGLPVGGKGGGGGQERKGVLNRTASNASCSTKGRGVVSGRA